MTMPLRRVITLIVDSTGDLIPPDDARVTPDTNVLFVLANEHAAHDFKLEFTNFRIKESGVPAQILGSPGHFRRLSPGELTCLKEKTKPRGNFGSGAGLLPFTTYKYDVVVTDLTAGTAPVTLDPDFDVPP
jgi:hypothetical protein